MDCGRCLEILPGSYHFLIVPQAQILADEAARLYARRASAVMVPFRGDSRLTPRRNECHANVEKWLELHPTHKAVRGWLVLDYREVEGHFGYRFFAHSVVEDATGSRFDVTVQSPYPFLEILGNEDDFAMLIHGHNLGAIDHYL